MATPNDLVRQCLELIGVISPNEAPSSSVLNRGFGALNNFIDFMKTQRQTIYYFQRTQVNLTPNLGHYSIGPGATFNVPRPANRDFLISVIPDRNAAQPVELPIGRPLSINDYQAIAVKSTTSQFPNAVYYDHNFDASGHATINVYPVPDNNSAALVFYVPSPVQKFTEAQRSTNISFPDGYEVTFVYNGAKFMAPIFDTMAPADVREIAKDTLAGIKRTNNAPKELRFDAVFLPRGRRFNLVTGGYD